ncbi:hypothetical protein GCM10010376_92900 [Streptomyces violaceusniger]
MTFWPDMLCTVRPCGQRHRAQIHQTRDGFTLWAGFPVAVGSGCGRPGRLVVVADDRDAVGRGAPGDGRSGAGRRRDVRFEFRIDTVQGPEAEALARQQVAAFRDVVSWVAQQREQSRASESTVHDEDGLGRQESDRRSSPHEG